MNEHIVLRTTIRLLVPLIIMYGLYVQFHGEYSPGGGFQAGVICASAFIVYGLIFGLKDLEKLLPSSFVRIMASLGVLIYAGVGVATLFMGGNFLNYSVLQADPVSGQKLGILVIELGVGITVFSVMMILFSTFAFRATKNKDDFKEVKK